MILQGKQNLTNYLNQIFTFYYPRKMQKVLYLDQIFETDFLIKLHVLRFPES